MTTESISAMPDAELVKATAERVMQWSVIVPDDNEEWFTRQTKGLRFPVLVMHREGGIWLARSELDIECACWWPIEDWNHTWQVVAAMRAKGFAMSISGYANEPKDFVMFYSHALDIEKEVAYAFGDEQRAILRAALAAVENV